MSTTLFFLVPICMLGVIWSLCFVGACFNTQGIPGPGYSGTVTSDLSLVAYWPLNDLIGSPLNMPTQTSGATDLSGNGHNGTYKIPPAYPPPTPATPSVQIINPSVGRGTTIIPGDAGSVKNPLPASADFEGGYVSIPWSTQNSPPLPEFTLEAWIKPSWTETESGFDWVVFGAGANNNTGFAIYVNAQNQWQLTIGNGTAFAPLNTNVPVDLASITYVALTCDKNGIMSLWVNPQGQSDTTNPPPPPANWTSQTSTGYVAVDPTQFVTFFIGAGDNNDAQTLRTQPMGGGAPLFPFKGQIQSVALYSAVLDATELQTHFTNGAG